MSPHALSLSSQSSRSASVHDAIENSHTKTRPKGSLLDRYDDDEIHDLICVGFGPASLAIAVALHDVLEHEEPALTSPKPSVRFLEWQHRFAWHAGMLLPGTKMQITFMKDLATLRNPRSEFTFINYLHRMGRLASFMNLGTFLPQRIEYEDYLRWCAGHFDDVVDYNQDVDSVQVGKKDPETGTVEYFQVKSFDRSTEKFVTRRAKHVVIAVGGKPNIPKSLQADHPRVIHSSQYATSISDVLPPGTQPKSIAVIGGGQSAAEVFHNVPSRYPEAKVYLLIRGGALRPNDDSPFVNEIFDPDRVDDVYSQDPQTRANGITLDKGTNYSVVRLELLESIYSSLYSHRIHHESEDDWPQQILNHRTVTGMSDLGNQNGRAIRLYIADHSGKYHAHKQSRSHTLDVDLVVVASGYRRDAHEDMLNSLRHLMPEQHCRVGRGYRVQFEEGAVRSDAGIWLQGCNESTHGLSDTLLSVLATRGGEIVDSIFGSAKPDQRNSNGDLSNVH